MPDNHWINIRQSEEGVHRNYNKKYIREHKYNPNSNAIGIESIHWSCLVGGDVEMAKYYIYGGEHVLGDCQNANGAEKEVIWNGGAAVNRWHIINMSNSFLLTSNKKCGLIFHEPLIF